MGKCVAVCLFREKEKSRSILAYFWLYKNMVDECAIIMLEEKPEDGKKKVIWLILRNHTDAIYGGSKTDKGDYRNAIQR